MTSISLLSSDPFQSQWNIKEKRISNALLYFVKTKMRFQFLFILFEFGARNSKRNFYFISFLLSNDDPSFMKPLERFLVDGNIKLRDGKGLNLNMDLVAIHCKWNGRNWIKTLQPAMVLLMLQTVIEFARLLLYPVQECCNGKDEHIHLLFIDK